MELSRNTFEQLSTLKKYNVEFEPTAYDYKERVCISIKGGAYSSVYYWYEISRLSNGKEYVHFNQRYSANNGRCDKGWTCGYNFTERIERDLKKANLI